MLQALFGPFRTAFPPNAHIRSGKEKAAAEGQRLSHKKVMAGNMNIASGRLFGALAEVTAKGSQC